MEFFRWFEGSSMMPHGYCMLWRPEIVWLHVLADLLIVAAYCSIPVVLFSLARRRPDMPYPLLPTLFGAFILCCALTHVMGIVTLWAPLYGLEGGIKLVTGVVSIGAAVTLYRLAPQIARLQSPAQLEVVNRRLEAEVARRADAERALEVANRALADQIDEKNAALAAANAEIEHFARASSHDLQEPLRTLISYSTLLPDDLESDLTPAAEEDLAFITSAAKRMQRLVTDLAALARVRRDGFTTEEVAVGECVEESLLALDARLRETDAEVRRPSELPTLQANERLLTQVYQNLIANGLKFVPKGVRPIMDVTAERIADGWILGLRDNGIGIDPKDAEAIFAPFRRLHGMAEYEGAGIGLAICHKAVDLHGGKIWVESEKGKGAHFRFSLPDRRAIV